ncbi:peroxisome biogenesis protein 19-2 [Canna indica]|uniref:Peroxisome biogenesis protein 19-2 n=1 Tax=Canna indica TaxID=4628 RepID=A0AAQ3QJ94_9LILI|nr:peroxisome biogenesis protein 19-2 [Canna indica]
MADPSASDDLDQLLDSALDDFSKIDLAPAQRDVGDGSTGKGPSPSSLASAPPVRGLGMGLPDLGSRRKGKQGARPKASYASEALEKLTQQTREAVRGLESATGVSPMSGGNGGEGMVEEFVKQFEELAGSQDMESIVETMMQQLLSKEILHEPMKEIGERYPKWLDEHKSTLKQEEFDRYHRQYELILKLNDVYDNEPENFSKIVDLMQKMQECGQPPSDIVQELAPDLDLSSLGNLSPDQLGAAPNCCIM